MSLRIMLDIDDVLFGLVDNIVHYMRKRGWVPDGEVDRWDMHECFGMTRDGFWEVVSDGYVDGLLLQPPYDGVCATLTALRDEGGHTVHLATARGFEGDLAALVRQDTVRWLTQHEVPHDSLTFTKDKTVIDADVYLDDGVHNVEALQRAGKRAYLRDQPHNRSADHLDGVRVLDLEHFVGRAVEPQERAA